MREVQHWLKVHYWQGVAGLSGGLIVLLFFLEVRPQITYLIDTIRDIHVNESKSQEVQNWEVMQAKLESKEEALQRQLNSLYIAIPRNDQMSVILECLQESNSGLELSLRQIKTKPPMKFASHQEQPVNVSAYGGFHAVGLFIDRIEKSPYLIKVEALQIERIGKLRSSLSATLSFHAIVVDR